MSKRPSYATFRLKTILVAKPIDTDDVSDQVSLSLSHIRILSPQYHIDALSLCDV